MPDLASTLTLQTENDVDEDNVDFLRSPFSESPEDLVRLRLPSLSSRQAYDRQRRLMLRLDDQRQQHDDQREQRRLRDLHLRQRYASHEAWLESMSQTVARVPYGDRLPSRQSLYDWAPPSAGDDNVDPEDFESILADLREQQPNTHPDVLANLGRAQLDARNEQRRLALSRTPAHGQTPSQHEHSLRSAAILRSVRTNRHLSARSRDLMQRYVLDSQRAAQESGEERSNSSQWLRTSSSENASRPEPEQSPGGTEVSPSNNMATATVTTTASTTAPASSPAENRRRHLEDPGGIPAKFEGSIKLLDYLRTQEYDMSDLVKVLEKEMAGCPSSIVIPDLSKLGGGLPPPPTSWLAPGMVFSGTQSAAPATVGSSSLYRLANNPSISSSAVASNSIPSAPRGSSSAVASNSIPSAGHSSAVASNNIPSAGHTSHSSAIPSAPVRASIDQIRAASDLRLRQQASTSSPERWAVRVSVHAVDYDSMTVQGTMEAFDVPSGPSVPRPGEIVQPPPSTFSTFLEGELVDLSKHTLATHSWPTSSADDARYWRRLEPFASMSDHDMAKAVMDPGWLSTELRDRYVLMRLKEKCFVRECLTERDGRSSASGSSRGSSPAPSQSGGNETRAGPSSSSGGGDNDGRGLLSISGFYYISMRRSDGHIDGLYSDPASSPYQELQLDPEDAPGSSAAVEFA